MTEAWAAVLKVSKVDRLHLQNLFGRTESRPVRIANIELPNGQAGTALFADSFSDMTEQDRVREEAYRLIKLINGILFIVDKGREPLDLISIHPWTSQGWGPGLAPLSVHVRSRSTLFGDLTSGVPLEPQQPRWLELAETYYEVRDVLLFLKNPEPDWFDLYKAYELLKSAKGKQEWATEHLFDIFKESAQFDRHAIGRYEAIPEEFRMNLDVATDFIQSMAQKWMNWWCVDEDSARTASRANVDKERNLTEGHARKQKELLEKLKPSSDA